MLHWHFRIGCSLLIVKFILVPIVVAVVFHRLLSIEEIRGGQFVNSSNNMGYLNSVLSSSSQVHADDAPVSGGGLRLILCFR